MRQPTNGLQIKKMMVRKPFSFISAMLVIAILLFVTQSSIAQYGQRKSGVSNSWELGFSGGASQFLTSINPNSDAPYKKFNYWNADPNAAVMLSVIKNFSPKFSAEFEFLTTKLSGRWNENNGYPVPKPATYNRLPDPFKTGINQFALMLVPNLNQIIAPNRASDKWYLFVKAGLGATILKGYSGLYQYIKPGNGFEYALAYGGGLSYTINEKIKLKLGATWYRVETDRLDGVHTMKPVQSLTPTDDNSVFYFNVKERYVYPYIGMTYGFGTIQSKAHFLMNSNRFKWFKPAKRRYKSRH